MHLVGFTIELYDDLQLIYKTSNVCRYRRNDKTGSRNHFCRGKAISITYSECVFVASGIQYATRMRHVINGQSGSAVPFHITSLKRHLKK